MTDVHPIVKPIRERNPAHLKRLRTLPCCIPGCQVKPVIAHHLTCGPEPKARGLKAGDQWAVALCERVHHSAQSNHGVHHTGGERAWWAAKGVDPVTLAARLWAETQALKGKKRE